MTKDIVFTLPGEAVTGATKVVLLGDFNNWDEGKGITLEKQEDGTLKAVVSLEAGKTYQYRFLLDDGRWVNDYHAQNYVPVSGLHIDNCVMTVPETSDIDQKPEPIKSETEKPESDNSGTEKPKTDKPDTGKPDTVKSEPVRPGTEDPETKNRDAGKAKTVKPKSEKAKTSKAATGKTATVKAEKKEAVKKKK